MSINKPEQELQFTTDWLSHVRPTWTQLLERWRPSTILEIGAFEGRTTCFLIEEIAPERPVEIHCVDTWKGGVEHASSAMSDVELRFDSNIAAMVAAVPNPAKVYKHKATSFDALTNLIARGMRGAFDLIYIDGSHQAPDVLADAVLSYYLARRGGLIIFDDYLWSMEPQGQENHFNMPKPAIDAFVNIYRQKLKILRAPLYQLYVEKRGD